jgi:hypothetical protein
VSDYTAEEWKTLVTAPTAAGLLISLSDASGPIGLAKESMAVVRAIMDAAGDGPAVVKAMAEQLKAGVRPSMPSVPHSDRAQAKAVVLETVKAGVAIVAAKSPTEEVAFKQWIVQTATKVAQASKEGTILGFGGTLVSPEEQAALNELAAALGVPAPTATT